MTTPTPRSILIRGPLTDAETAAIVSLMQSIESAHPDQHYTMIVDDRGRADDEVRDCIDMLKDLNPGKPGYKRIIEFWPTEAEQS